MKQKDLAEEYLDRKIKQELFKSLTKGFEYAFSVDDIKEAFNAGRESVVENIPELEWKIFPTEEYYSTSLLGWSYRIMLSFNEFALFCNSHYLMSFLSVEEAKQAANEDYKQQIKQALGL